MEVSTKANSSDAGARAKRTSPLGWRHVRLTDVARLESGHTPSKRNPEYWGGSIPWVSLYDTEGLDTWEIQTTSQTITEAGLANSSARLLPKGTVVFSRTATVGKSTVMGCSMATSQDFACYVCGPEVHNFYLALLLRSMRAEWKKLMAGSIHNTVYMPVFKTLSVDLPPHNEQVAVAEALRDVERHIDSLDQLLTKKRQIKQGAMQELLTGRRRLPGFTRDWDNKRLGDLLSIRHGRSQKQVECEGGDYPILATGGQIGWANEYLHDRPSVLIGRKGTIDQPRYMDTPFWSVDTLFYSDVHSPNVAKFLYYRFCLIEWMRHNEASGVPSLGAKVIESIEISFPESDEQQAIADVLSDMDVEISALESRLVKARALKQAMVQALLTGRIRLVEPNA